MVFPYILSNLRFKISAPPSPLSLYMIEGQPLKVKNFPFIINQIFDIFLAIMQSFPDTKDLILEINGTKKLDFEIIFSSPRNYREMTIINVDNFEIFSKIFENFGANLNFLKIVDCNLSDCEMLKIFELTSRNLKTLHLEKILRKSSIEESIKFSFKFLQLENLLFLNCEFFDLFEYFPDTLQSFSFYAFTGKQGEDFEPKPLDVFSNFLVDQKNLTELKIYILKNRNFDHTMFGIIES